MEFWLNFLPIVIYVLLIALLVVGIILGIKTIITMNKVEKVVDNVNDKVQSLDSVFNVIDFTTDRIAGITDRVVDFFTSLFGKVVLNRRRKNKEDKESE
jgi:uncharacterized protein YoxC